MNPVFYKLFTPPRFTGVTPVYMYPELLKDISPDLKKRMQGKSCFNFKKVEPELLRELEILTRKGAEKFKKENGS